MTDEEMAEKYALNDIRYGTNDGTPRSPIDIVEEAYLAGLKAGWHDLRKDKKDLPDNNRCVWTNVGAGYYDGDGDGWWDDFGRLQDVIAWCEPKFEE